jgi:predicted TIM-barrel fold metal-dependent hydrolase
VTAAAADAAERQRAWDAWLALRQEAALDPEVPVIDPHHHLWDRGGHTYLPAEFAADVRAGGHRVESTLYVECLSQFRDSGPEHLRPVGETEFVAGLPGLERHSDGLSVAAGIVARADLALGEGVIEVLEAHQRVARGRLRGVRFASAFDTDPAIHLSYPTRAGMLREPAVQAGARCLARQGLSFDAWLFFHQLDDLRDLASACPDLQIVIDHCGAPIGIGPYANRREEVFGLWREALRPLGALPNVQLKFGGLAMPVFGFGWRKRERPPDSEALAQAWRPYFEVCLETFGPGRCMFESNFPMDRTGCTYGSLWNAFKRLAAPLAPDERALLLHGTARRVYRL